MKTRIINAIVVTLDEENRVYRNGEIAIVDNEIVYVGDMREGNIECDKLIDAEGNIIMPGFVNTHCHMAMSLFRGLGENSNFNNWWFDFMRPKEILLEERDCYHGVMLSITEMLRNGITTVADFYMHNEETAEAVADTGIRASIGIGAITGSEILDEEYLLKEMDKVKSYSPLIKPILYAHSVYSCDESQFAELARFASKYKLVVSTHASETLKEVGECSMRHNMTPIELLESIGFLDVPCVLAHCVHCDKDDVEILKRYDVTIATNPSSNLVLGSGIAPLYSYIKNEINVSIGTDGPASNNALDMFKEMFLADNLQAGVLNQAYILTVIDSIKMATVRGAMALGYDNLGILKEGYLADMIMLDTTAPNMQPLHSVFNNIVNSANPSNVVMTMVNGKVLYDHGVFNIDKSIEDIRHDVDGSIKRIFSEE